MERIHSLLRKLQEIYYKQEEKQLIDLDLMLDYTRVLYADLLDARTDMLAKQGMGLHLKPQMPNQAPAVKEEQIVATMPDNDLIPEKELEEVIEVNEEMPETTASPIEEEISIEEEVETEEELLEEKVDNIATQEEVIEETIVEETVKAPELEKEPLDTELKYANAVEEEGSVSIEETTIEIAPANTVKKEELSAPVQEEPVFSEIHFELPDVKDNAAESPKQGYVFQNKIKDIRSFIGINDKYQFMNELFANNKTAYEETLDKIAFCNNFAEAEAWLSKTATERYSWKSDDDTFQSLVATAKKYFSA